jgi:hypothetical protein
MSEPRVVSNKRQRQKKRYERTEEEKEKRRTKKKEKVKEVKRNNNESGVAAQTSRSVLHGSSCEAQFQGANFNQGGMTFHSILKQWPRVG